MSARADQLGISEHIGEDWKDLFIPKLTGGVISALDEELLPSLNILTGQNVITDRQILTKDSGYSSSGMTLLSETVNASQATVPVDSTNGFAANDEIYIEQSDGTFERATINSVDDVNSELTLTASASIDTKGLRVVKVGLRLRGNPKKFFSYRTIDGTDIELLVTNLSVYKKVSGAWWYVSNGTSTTLSANEASGQTVLSVTSTTGFATNEFVGITLNDGSQHQAKITGVGGGTITIDEALPSAADSGNAVVEAVLLGGSDSKAVIIVNPPWSDLAVFTNGVDTVKQYDPSTDEVGAVPNLPSSGDTVCRSLAIYDSSLFLINTIEGGSNKRQRVRWSNKADLTNWSTGDSGFIDLFDSTQENLHALALGPFLIIYRADSISRAQLSTGSSTRFLFETVVTDEGLLATEAVVDAGDFHILTGNTNFYIYSGGFDLQSIGDDIRLKVFGPSAILNKEDKDKTFSVYLEQRDEFIFFYPDNLGTGVNRAWRYNLKDRNWLERTFQHNLSGHGLSSLTTSPTWLDLEGTWEEQNWTWGGASGSIGTKTLILLTTDKRVSEYDYVVGRDAGAQIPVIVETKDFGHPNFLVRFDYIEFKASGSNIKVERSHDQGASWSEIGTENLGTSLVRSRLHESWTERITRFRFQTSDGFSLAWLHLRFTLEYEW